MITLFIILIAGLLATGLLLSLSLCAAAKRGDEIAADYFRAKGPR